MGMRSEEILSGCKQWSRIWSCRLPIWTKIWQDGKPECCVELNRKLIELLPMVNIQPDHNYYKQLIDRCVNGIIQSESVISALVMNHVSFLKKYIFCLKFFIAGGMVGPSPGHALFQCVLRNANTLLCYVTFWEKIVLPQDSLLTNILYLNWNW